MQVLICSSESRTAKDFCPASVQFQPSINMEIYLVFHSLKQ